MTLQNRGIKSGSRRELRRELRHRDTFSNRAIFDHSESKPFHSSDDDRHVWAPSSYTVFKALLSVRLCAATWNNIQDCDETFNYWEPTHELLYGRGLQTWEYAPQFALRSYAYILIHMVPAHLYSMLLQSNRLLVFYFLRWVLALCCVICEVCFYCGVRRQLGNHVARLTLVFLGFSAGMFIASSAYLPSSFSMYLSMLAVGAWMLEKPHWSVFAVAFSALVGWPFAVIIGAPIAYDIVFRQINVKGFIKWSVVSLILIVVTTVKIDSYFYGRLVFPSMNIVLYNVFSTSGANLYGTEPFSFYIINLFLNFNIAFVAAVISLPFSLCLKYYENYAYYRQTIPTYLLLAPMYIWWLVFFVQSHKEERFMFPVFPFICMAAAILVDSVQRLYDRITLLKSCAIIRDRGNQLLVTTLLLFITLSFSRVVGQYRAFHAPLDTFMHLNRLANERMRSVDRSLNICVGREWHRFPSSFFLPRLEWRLAFIESDFRGQLPKYFQQSSPLPTAAPAAHFNDANRLQLDRYVQPDQCHLLVDIDLDGGSVREPNYSALTANWTLLHSTPFLHAPTSNRLLRAFYVPFVTEHYCNYVAYNLLVNRRHQKSLLGRF